MRLTRLDYLFWAAGFIFNLTLLIILVYRRRFRTFPFFTALISLVVAKTAILYLVRAWANPHDYFYAYWSLTVADTLRLAEVNGLRVDTLHPMGRHPWLKRMRPSLFCHEISFEFTRL